ncbi:MAG: TonB family protein [Stenotrophomonas sp.]
MTSTDLLRLLLETTLASSAAMLLVLALRMPVRRWLGASAAYLLWLAVPVALVAVLLPAPRVEVVAMAAVGNVMQAETMALQPGLRVLPWPLLAGACWLAGASLAALWLLRQQRGFVRGLGQLQRRDDGLWQARTTAGLPAVVGLWRPRIVLPAGFEQRYSGRERQLVLLHEQVHLRRGDIAINALLALLQCLYWFNPLLPLALRRCREDQELSCDERVIAHGDGARRSYANAMLKTGLALSPLPVGCHWQDQHPLKERIAMLKRPVPGKKQWLAMVLLSAGLSCGVGYAAWAAQPVQQVAGEAKVIYSAAIEASADGERQRFELHQPAGEPFGFSITSGKGVVWNAEFTLVPDGEGFARLKGELKADGVLVGSPELRVGLNHQDAGIGVTTPDGGSLLEAELRLARVDAAGEGKAAPAAATNAGRIAVEPEVTEAPAQIPTVDRMPPPSYPREAFESSISGKVVLIVEVAADGTPTDVQVESAQPQGVFDASAVAAAKQWKFNPALQNGKPVAGKVRVPIWYDLDEDANHADANGGS